MSYESCNQSAKDLVNSILVHETCRPGTSTSDVVVTLDDVDNGTCSYFERSSTGYNGRYVVVQLDTTVAEEQDAQWREAFPNEAGRFTVHAKQNICNDFSQLSRFWVRSQAVRLWNLDFFSTFYTVPVRSISLMLNLPSNAFVADERGTLVALTFQAVPHGGLLAKLRTKWPERCTEYDVMRSWTDTAIAKFYLKKVNAIIAQDCQKACTKVQPVSIQTESGAAVCMYKNSIVYRGKSSKDSVMMFILLRASHSGKCTTQHEFANKPTAPQPTAKQVQQLEAVEDGVAQEEVEKQIVKKRTRKRKNAEDSCSGQDKRSCPNGAAAFSESGNESIGTDMDVDMNVGVNSNPYSDDDGFASSDESDNADDDVFGDSDNSTTDSCGETDVDSDTESESSSDSASEELNLATAPTDDSSAEWTDISQFTLFDHQREIVQAVADAPSRGYISAICGSGKSLPMTVCCKAVPVSIIFVPYKILVEQFYQQYFSHETSCDVYRVNSDHNTDIPLPKPGRTSVYLANFDSAHRVAALGITFDLVNWDEAHLATSERRRKGLANGSGDADPEIIDAGTVRIDTKKSIFWTATPNRAMQSHPEIYGNEIYKYCFTQAVSDRIIKSFGIFISCYKDDELDESATTQYEKIVDLSGKFIETEGCKRVLIYVNRVDDQDGNELLSVDHMKATRRLFPRSFRMDFLSAKTTAKARRGIFDKFRDASRAGVHVIVSCRTVSVGVDLPNCDAVIFASTTRNAADIIQRGLRPCRLTAEERGMEKVTPAKIFFPINVSALDVGEVIELNKRNGEIHKSIRGNALETPMTVLSLLKNGLGIDYNYKVDGQVTAWENRTSESSKAVSVSVTVSFPAARASTSKGSWEQDLTSIVQNWGKHLCVEVRTWCVSLKSHEQFVARKKHLPKMSSDDLEEKRLAIWFNNQRHNYSKRRLTARKRCQLESLAYWYKDQDELWARTASSFRAFVMHNRRWPKVQRTTDGTEEAKLATWFVEQKKRKKGQGTGKQLTIEQELYLESIPGWEWRRPTWSDKLEALRKFIQDHQRYPSSSANTTETVLFEWIKRNRDRESELSLVQCQTLDALPGWEWKVTLSTERERIWTENLNALREFVQTHGRYPVRTKSTEQTLCNWKNAQVVRYKLRSVSERGPKDQSPLSDKEVKLLEAVPGWTWNWRAGTFFDNMTRTTIFVQHTNRLPNKRSPNDDERTLGIWVSNVRSRGKEAYSNDKVAALEDIPSWKWEVNKEEQWQSNLTGLLDFIESCNRVPNSKAARATNERKLGQWFADQKKNKKARKLSSERTSQIDEVLLTISNLI